MAALLTMIAVMAILLSAALPVWRHELRREREAELVFRGEQYVHAIGLFQRKFATFPPNIDALVQQKFLRKKYLDPITGKEFRPIHVGESTQQETRRQPGAPAATSPGRPPGLPVGAGGLMGVASTSDGGSIRIYKGRTKYSQWQFTYAAAAARPGGPGGVQRPGQPGVIGPGQRGPIGPGGMDPGAPGRPRGPGGPGTRPPGSDQRPFGPVVRPPGGN